MKLLDYQKHYRIGNRCMDWESNYKYLDLSPNSHITETKTKTQNMSENINATTEAKEILQKCTIEGNIVNMKYNNC